MKHDAKITIKFRDRQESRESELGEPKEQTGREDQRRRRRHEAAPGAGG